MVSLILPVCNASIALSIRTFTKSGEGVLVVIAVSDIATA
jgi:hypothetical protein